MQQVTAVGREVDPVGIGRLGRGAVLGRWQLLVLRVLVLRVLVPRVLVPPVEPFHL